MPAHCVPRTTPALPAPWNTAHHVVFVFGEWGGGTGAGASSHILPTRPLTGAPVVRYRSGLIEGMTMLSLCGANGGSATSHPQTR